VVQDAAGGEKAAPEKDERYPLKVIYCGECGLPPELCEYNPPEVFEKCKPWLREHAPDVYPELQDDEAIDSKLKDTKISDTPAESTKATKKKKKVGIAPEVIVQKSQRKGRKQVTVVYGLDLFGIKIQDVAKVCKKKFSCGAALVKAPDQRDTLEVQGDRIQALAQYLRDDFNVPMDRIFTMDESKAKVPAFATVAEGVVNPED